MNLVIISGRITKDPELVQAGKYKKCDFTVAVNNIRNEKADFIDCIVWEKQAENFAQYMRKGGQVIVRGWLTINQFETKTGTKVKQVKVQAELIEFMGNNKKEAEEEQKPIEAPLAGVITAKSPYDFVKETQTVSSDDLPF